MLICCTKSRTAVVLVAFFCTHVSAFFSFTACIMGNNLCRVGRSYQPFIQFMSFYLGEMSSCYIFDWMRNIVR